MKISDTAISLTVFLIIIGVLFVPVGLKNFNSNIANDKYQNTFNISNNVNTQIAHDTTITITSSYANANATYSLYYSNNLVGTYTQNEDMKTKRTTDGGDIYIGFDDIQDTYSSVNVYHSDVYGSGAVGKTIMDNIIIILFAVILISLMYYMKVI